MRDLRGSRRSPIRACNPDELPASDFEISVLVAHGTGDDIGEIEVGRHGLIDQQTQLLEACFCRRLRRHIGWDRDTVSPGNLPGKPDCDPDDWKNGATIQRFGAFVFGESHLRQTAAS